MTDRNIPKLRFPGFTDEWKKCRLGDIADINMGKMDANAMKEDGKFDFYTSGMQKFKIDVPAFEGPAITIAGNGSAVGSMHMADGKFNAYQRTYVLNNFSADREFLFYEIGNRLPEKIRQEVRTGNIPYIVMDTLTDLAVSVPDINEQKKIGTCFHNLDSLIDLYRCRLDELNELKKGLLQKMFPRKGKNVPELRFPGFTEPWKRHNLGEIVSFMDAQRKPLEESDRAKGQYPYYGASGIVDYVADYIFDEELILLGEDGSNIIYRNFPVCFLASGKYWVNNHVHVLKAEPNMDNNFICISLEKKDYSRYSTGIGMPKLTQNACSKIPVMCPSYLEQKKIGDHFRNIANLIKLYQRKLEELNELKKGLLQQMLVQQEKRKV